MSMTDAEDLSKSEVFSKVTKLLIPWASAAAEQGCSMKDFEKGLLGGVLKSCVPVVDQFLKSQGDGDLGQTINALRRDDAQSSGTSESGESRRIYRSAERATRKLRSVFGEHTMSVFVYHASDDPNSAIVRRPVDERLGISPDRYSPLLQEYSMLFCCEQAFHGAVEAFETVFRQRLSADTLEKVSRRMGAAANQFLRNQAAPEKTEEGSILVVTADGKGVPLVKADAQRLTCFEEKSLRPGNRRMATVCGVYSIDAYNRTAESVVAALFRDTKSSAESESTGDRPVPCHKRLLAQLPGVVEGLGDDVIRGSILALTWAADEVRKRLQPGQRLVRLIDGQHSLWDDLNACQSDLDEMNMTDILDLLHAAGYVGKAAKDLCQGETAQEEFMKDRLLRILHGGVHSVIRGMKRMATVQGLSKDERANVDAACHYFTAHAHRMKYDEYLAAGLPIATGIIEGACRHLVKDRLERTGMRWSTEGAQGMLNLRSIRASNLWDDFQNHYFATSSLTA
jgi:hypothetical protein